MRVTAVVDRIEGDMAVLLVGPDERRVDWPVDLLPYIYDGTVLAFTIDRDEDEEARRVAHATRLLERLQRKNKDKA